MTGREHPPPVDERGPRWPIAVAIVCVLALVVGIGVWFTRDRIGLFRSEECRATALDQSVTFQPDQMHNASTIVLIAVKRGMPARAGSIGIATAIRESKLRNLSYGDRDSVGLFQQRPSRGWGTVEQLQEPVFATNAFYDAPVKVDGWQDMVITEIAREVQRSGFPGGLCRPRARRPDHRLRHERPLPRGIRLPARRPDGRRPPRHLRPGAVRGDRADGHRHRAGHHGRRHRRPARSGGRRPGPSPGPGPATSSRFRSVHASGRAAGATAPCAGPTPRPRSPRAGSSSPSTRAEPLPPSCIATGEGNDPLRP
uniref:Uncharacterized protein n=1 Tax=Janibacter limosus TaxID=53458 RepID=A0AC61U689_9MICO|nr:hypothetical protein [Janibacter limosus]